jgi:SAM-dependent MidA family methyltransferase
MAFEDFSTRDKVLVVGGGVLAGVFLLRGIMGSKSNTTAVPVVDTSSNTGANVEQEVSAMLQANQQQTGDLIAQQGKNMLDMITGFQESNTAVMDSMSRNFSDAISSLKDSQDSTVQGVSSLLDNMQKTMSYPSSNPANTTVQTQQSKPTVNVIPGSPDEKALKIAYGDSINYNYTAKNQFIGADRETTFNDYTAYLGSQGVTAKADPGNLEKLGTGVVQ